MSSGSKSGKPLLSLTLQRQRRKEKRPVSTNVRAMLSGDGESVVNCEPTCVTMMVHIDIMERVLRATLRARVRFGHDFLTSVVFRATARVVEDETIGTLEFGCDGGW